MVDGQRTFFINTPDVVSSVLLVRLHRKLSIKVPCVLVNHIGTVMLG